MLSKEYNNLLKEKRTEHDEQVEVVKYLRKNKILHTAIPNGGQRHKKTAVDLKREGVVAGYPDLLIEEPNKYYQGLRIEMKRRARTLKNGRKSVSHTKVSDEQKQWLLELNERGYCARVCYGADEAIELIEDYMENVL